jgi:hypothetical protein
MDQLKAILPKHLTILQEFPGHMQKLGKNAGEFFNPYVLVKSSLENDIENEFYAIFSNPDKIFYISKEFIQKIKNKTCFYCSNGYMALKDNNKQIYLHQLIMENIEKNDNEKELSIDHINRDKLDNRIKNLRYTTQSIQNENRGKKNRNKNARPLPEELKNYPLPKYVEYSYEELKNGNYRDFILLNHPSLEKRKASSKSMNISIVDKYNQIINFMKELDLKIEIKE